MLTMGHFTPYFSSLDFFILIHCLANWSLNDSLEAGHVGAPGYRGDLSDVFAQEQQLGW